MTKFLHEQSISLLNGAAWMFSYSGVAYILGMQITNARLVWFGAFLLFASLMCWLSSLWSARRD